MTRDRVLTKAGVVIASLVVAAACNAGQDAIFPPPSASQDVYWRLSLNYRAINLATTAPYDTLRLVVTPKRYNGETFVAEADVPVTTTFRSTDSSKVSVSSDGLLRARAPGSRLQIIATRQIGNVTHVDTALVSVDSAPDLQRLSQFRIRPTDSTKRAITIVVFPVTVLDHAGNPDPDVVFRVDYPDTTIAMPFRNPWATVAQLKQVGTTLVRASTWRYGVVYTDTFTLRIGHRIATGFGITDTTVAGKRTVRIYHVQDTVGTGGTVSWTNSTTTPETIVFDDPTNFLASALNPAPDDTATGNVLVPSDTALGHNAERTRYRTIRVPGSYPFHTVPGNARGTIVVSPD